MPSDSNRPRRPRQGTDDSTDTFSSTGSGSHSRSRRDDRRGEEYYRSDRRRRRDRKESHDSERYYEDEDRYREKEKRRRRRDKERVRDEDRRRRRERRAERRAKENHADEYLRIHSPPAYQEKPGTPQGRSQLKPKRKDSQDHHGDGEQGTQATSDRHLSKLERFGGPFIYIIPLLTAFGLLAASTCSADWWRKDVNVVRLGLPGDVYSRLLATGNNLGKGGGEAVVSSGGQVEGRGAKISPQGWLSVGFWGWCVGPEGDGPWACSETDAWYTMDELLETAAVTIPTDAYFVGLMHGIMVHGLATMAATVPAGILIWRRYIKDDKTIAPGLALHASIFSGSAFSFIAFVIDKALQARLGGQTKYPVEQGSVPIMTGTSALLLFLAFLVSVAPGIHRRVKRQQEYAGSWEDVHAASELKRSVSVGTTATGLTRSKTWMKRMTRMGR